jgi:ribosomal protein S18 acetylase RimI-like enzyme
VETVAARFRDAADGNFTLGAFEGGRLAGMVTFVRDTGVKDRHKGHIYGVYVSASHRGKGVGRALINQLLERAKRDPSLEQIQLAVGTTQDAAKGLYRSFGFVTYGTEPRGLKVGSTYVDEDHMILRLRS